MAFSQVSPSVRLSAARTVLQMSFKAAQQFTLQARLDQLETGLAALEEEQEDHPHPRPQSKIDSNPLYSTHPASTVPPHPPSAAREDWERGAGGEGLNPLKGF